MIVGQNVHSGTSGTRLAVSAVIIFAAQAVFGAAAATSGWISCGESDCSAIEIVAFSPESDSDRFTRIVGRAERQPIASSRTAADGRFKLDLQSGTFADVSIRDARFAPVAARVLAGDDRVVLVARPAAWHTARVVFDQKPVAGATILWWREAATFMSSSDERGQFTLPAAAEGTIAIYARGHAPLVLRVDTMRPLRAEYALERGVSLTGKVTTGPGTVVVDDWPLGAVSDGVLTVTNAPSRWTRLALADGSRFFEPVAGESAIASRRAISIGGVVSDHRTRERLRGCIVALQLSDGRVIESVTDDRGAYAFRLPYWEAGTIAVEASGYRPLSKSLGIDLPARLSLSLQPGDTIRSSIDRGGTAVPAVPVVVRQTYEGGNTRTITTFTDRNGRFAASGIDPAQPVNIAATDGAGHAVRLETRPARVPPKIALDGTIRYRGVVLDGRGTPLAGASVHLLPSSDLARAALGPDDVPVAVTGADGSFSIAPGGGIHVLAVRSNGLATAWAGPFRVPADDIRVTLIRPRSVTGVVRWVDGQPVAAAVIRLLDTHSQTQTTFTDSTGSFEFEAAGTGPLLVEIRKTSDLVRERRELPAAQQSQKIGVNVPPGAKLAGRVVAASSGRPVPAFRLMFRAGSGGRGQAVAQEVDSAAGAFALLHVPAGQNQLAVRASGFAQLARAVTVSADAPPLELALAGSGVLSGRVVDEHRVGIEGVAIESLRPDAPPEANRAIRLAETSADGSYRIDSVTPSKLTLRFSKSGYAPATVTVTPAEQEESSLDISLLRGVALRGIVVNADGGAIEGADVHLTSAAGEIIDETVSAADGSFELSGLNEGEHVVAASKSGRVSAKIRGVTRRSVEGAPLRLVLLEGATIAGRVEGLSDEEMPDVRVTAQTEGDQVTVPVGADRTFRLEGVRPGDVRIRGWLDRPGGRATPPKLVRVPDRGEARADVVFEKGARIAGRITFQQQPCNGCVVRFWPMDPTANTDANVTADAEGRYAADALSPGAYSVTVVSRTFGTYERTYDVIGDATLDIAVEGAVVRGSVRAEDSGAPIGRAAVFAERTDSPSANPRPRTMTSASGDFQFGPLAPGTYRVRFQARGYAEQVITIDVAAAPVQQDVQMRAADGIVVTAVDAATGARIPALLVIRDASDGVVFEDSLPADVAEPRIPLGAGTYAAMTYAKGYAPAATTLRAPGPAVSIAMSAGGTLIIDSPHAERRRGRILSLPANSVYRLNPYLRSADFALNPGANIYESVAPGEYVLLVSDPKGAFRPPVRFTITRGQTTTVQPTE